MTIFGASSAKRSRTTNSSLPLAVDRRAAAAQSIEYMSSPGRYGFDPATSEPEPRLRLRIVPNESPITRRRGTGGNGSREPALRAPLYTEGGRYKSGSSSEPGFGATSRHPSRKSSIAAGQLDARARATKPGG